MEKPITANASLTRLAANYFPEMKLPKIIRNEQHRGELVSASEEAVGRIQAVLFGSSIPETARMDINCATNDAVAAGERIPHCARTAIGTVVAMAGTHAM